MSSPRDVEALVRGVQRSLGAAESTLRQLLEAVASLPQPSEREQPVRCPHCGPLKAVRNERQLAEHMQNVHGASL